MSARITAKIDDPPRKGNPWSDANSHAARYIENPRAKLTEIIPIVEAWRSTKRDSKCPVSTTVSYRVRV
jgi:hypothetical protein